MGAARWFGASPRSSPTAPSSRPRTPSAAIWSSRPRTWTRRWNCPRAVPSWKATDRWRSAPSFPCRAASPGRAATEDVQGLVDHLFRREAGKMVSYLTRIFGLGRLDLAEDVVQDTLCRALEIWPIQGMPDNPSAWLMRVAHNRAIDIVRRDDQFRLFAPEIVYLLKRQNQPAGTPVFEKEIQDDQLRMMFSCCHPDLSTEVQVTLILKTLCGFSVSEIAHSFLGSDDSIEKRLGRARNLFRLSGSLMEIINASDIPKRLEAVYQAIYLLFNEGYHGSRSEQIVREDLCFEAIRLGLILS